MHTKKEDECADTQEINSKNNNISLELWDNIRNFIEANVELGDPREYDLLCGWVFSNWIPETWSHYPYLYIHGTYKSGKSRCLNVLKALSFASIKAENMTPATIYRVLDSGWHTLFVDEFELSLQNRSDYDVVLSQVLNSGYERGGEVYRCVGKEHVPTPFKTEGFKALGSIYSLPNTLRSRCVTIRMRKSKRFFPLRIDEKRVEQLRAKLKEWKSSKPQLGITRETEEMLFKESGNDGRLAQLFSSLYTVAPDEKKSVILDYLGECGELEQEEELASWECEIFSAICRVVYSASFSGNWFATKDIAEAYNLDRPEREQLKSRTIGRQIRQFGFKPHRSANQRGWKYDQTLMDKLHERYPIVVEQLFDVNPENKIEEMIKPAWENEPIKTETISGFDLS